MARVFVCHGGCGVEGGEGNKQLSRRMSEGVCRKGCARKGGLEGEERGKGDRKGGAGGRRGAVGVWGGREAGGRRREGKEVAK